MKQLYSLRKNFTIIGVTGKNGAGCSEIAKQLSDKDFNKSLKNLIQVKSTDTDQLKLNVCSNYLLNDNNWFEFKVLHYKDVLFFHLIYEAINTSKNKYDAINEIMGIIYQNGVSSRKEYENRYDIKDGADQVIKKFFNDEGDKWFNYPNENLTCSSLKECLKSKKECPDFYDYYFNFFEDFSSRFYTMLNKLDLTKRTRLTHDLANNLRAFGTIHTRDEKADLNNIYTIAETINRLIKNWKEKNEHTKIVIDSLKNSLELMYFKEKYSAFYTIATNKSDYERKLYLKNKISERFKDIYSEDEINSHVKNLIQLDDSEYKGSQFNSGEFSSPDIENCIQKSDYHIFYSQVAKVKNEKIEFNNKIKIDSEGELKLKKELANYHELDLLPQLTKLIALIHQPGIITPTAYERIMQVAFSAKVNSGCISRQVGAVVTDESYSIKAIGWNDIPRFQIPCNLRSANDLIKGENSEHFSDFEKGQEGKYKDGESFKKKFTNEFTKIDDTKLEGKPCSFCFKTFHNAFEGEKNQVHTRSLHAEENAMLQITKYGGQGLKNGNLFTTASPCELCSKKAFQLGIKRIFYIDPYPGIATTHILTNTKNKNAKPKLLMFQGAVGKSYHKLFEPFMAYKDELNILANIKPKENKALKIEDLTKNKDEQDLISKIINDTEFRDKVSKL
jgi:deoxycytidylate deaminase